MMHQHLLRDEGKICITKDVVIIRVLYQHLLQHKSHIKDGVLARMLHQHLLKDEGKNVTAKAGVLIRMLYQHMLRAQNSNNGWSSSHNAGLSLFESEGKKL